MLVFFDFVFYFYFKKKKGKEKQGGGGGGREKLPTRWYGKPGIIDIKPSQDVVIIDDI